MEDVVVLFGVYVDGGDAVDDLAEGDAPTTVAHGDMAILDAYYDSVHSAHDELAE